MKNKSVDDLEYLSQLGFEKIPAGEKDLPELKKKVKARFFPYTHSFYLIAISLVLGAFIGALVFYAISSGSVKRVENDRVITTKVAPRFPAESQEMTVTLDTVDLVKDNFIKPMAVKSSVRQIPKQMEVKVQDTLQVISMPPATISTPLREPKIKFIINSPVVFIHDLKVSDYTMLYFKKNQFVKFNGHSGVTANYAGKNESQSTNPSLKQQPDYYLHQELADGLLHFKQRRYDACILALNDVLAYNKTDVNCDFYLAMCFYHKKNYSKALVYFNQCIESLNNAFLQESTYYKAQVLLGQGNKNEAANLLKKIVEEGEFYSNQAKVDLESL